MWRNQREYTQNGNIALSVSVTLNTLQRATTQDEILTAEWPAGDSQPLSLADLVQANSCVEKPW